MHVHRRSLAAMLLATLTALVTSLLSAPPSSAATDPRLTRSFHVDPHSSAAVAARDDPRFATLATTPQAFWVTDHLSATSVRRAVWTYADLAVRKKRTPVVAVYAIPARDCGSHSAGTFDAATYKKWVAQVSYGLKGKKAIVILEPDALAMLGDCEQGDRKALLRYAARKIAAAGAWVYLDAGHSGWRTPATMAARLRSSGIGHARGFSTNVASFQSTAAEKRYANAVAAELKKLGVTARRYVIDTSRNGGTGVAAGEFCNPAAARVGARPRVVRKGNLDAYLWVKHPGESDGACNGGTAAGQWWAAGALTLLGP